MANTAKVTARSDTQARSTAQEREAMARAACGRLASGADDDGDQEDCEAGRRKVEKLHDLESTIAADTWRTGAGVTIAYWDADGSVTINVRQINRD